MRRFRTVIIGADFMGRTHLEALRRLGSVEIRAIAAASLEEVSGLATAFGIERAEAAYRIVLKDPSIRALHVCTPTMTSQRPRSTRENM